MEHLLNRHAFARIRPLCGLRPSDEAPVYDWRELKHWHIDPARLPAGSEIRFRPASLWDEHRAGSSISKALPAEEPPSLPRYPSARRLHTARELRLVQPDAFYLNSQQHVLFESILLAVIHAEIRAVEGARSVGAANLLLEHGMIKAFE
jgi:hypothetical protein